MKHKKIIIPSGLAVALIAILGISIAGGPISKEYISATIAPFDPEYGTEVADTIALGKITDVRTESTGNPDHPLVAIATMEVEKYLKNPQNSTMIEIRDWGQGVFEDPEKGKVELIADSADFKVGEKVVVFLNYVEGHVLGDGYYVYSTFLGKYSIDKDGMAKNKDPKLDTSEEDLEKVIKDTLAKKKK